MAVAYELFIEPEVHAARDELPGHVRQRIRRAIDDLAQVPRPARSLSLDSSALDVSPEVEIRRLRLDCWRLIYAVHDQEGWVWVLGLRRRPPYDYADLPDFVRRVGP